MKTKISIIEDDPSIALGLSDLLRMEGFEVSVCADGAAAMQHLKEWRPGLIVLDVMLPGKSGYDLCREIRAEKWTAPILMLTAKGQEIDKVVGLELGADDYVVKPFGVRELLARIHAILRRVDRASGSSEFRIGGSAIDAERMKLTRGRETYDLTARELKLLQLFHAAPEKVLSRDHLLNEVWGLTYYGNTRTLDQVIVQLRKKLGDDAMSPRHLKTVHGVGYRLYL